jgi:predicted nuclease of predicted toxin-antitoxin system
VNFLADEGVDRQIVEALRALSFDVTYIAEFRPSMPDPDVLALASAEGRILVTADKGFGELVFRRRQASQGVLLLRLAGVAPDLKATLVTNVVVTHGSGLSQSFTVVTPRLTRIRHSPGGA